MAENQTNFQETQICSIQRKITIPGRKIEAPKIFQITPKNLEVFIENLTYVKDVNVFHSDK